MDSSAAGDAARAAALARMRALATGLLIALLAVFFACLGFGRGRPWLQWPLAFAEAGSVGALADWFAVVALFRRPLGLPIPHTAILPRNQPRLARSLGVFIADNFLSPAVVEPRLARLELAAGLARWLESDANVGVVVEAVRAMLPTALELTGDEALRAFLRQVVREGVDSIAAAPLASRIVSAVVRRGHAPALYDRAVGVLAGFLEENRAAIRRYASDKRGNWLSSWFDGKAADSFVAGVSEMLEAAAAPDHPWRERFEALLGRLAERLATDPELLERGERLKADVLEARLLEQYLDWLADRARAGVEAELAAQGGVVDRVLREGLAAASRHLAQDARLREMIDGWARQIVVRAVVPHRAQIGAFVTDVVAGWDAQTLSRRLELHVGRDLQYIRINGALVGGLAGLALHAAARLMGAA